VLCRGALHNDSEAYNTGKDVALNWDYDQSVYDKSNDPGLLKALQYNKLLTTVGLIEMELS
jgi:hypothetical protein